MTRNARFGVVVLASVLWLSVCSAAFRFFADFAPGLSAYSVFAGLSGVLWIWWWR